MTYLLKALSGFSTPLAFGCQHIFCPSSEFPVTKRPKLKQGRVGMGAAPSRDVHVEERAPQVLPKFHQLPGLLPIAWSGSGLEMGLVSTAVSPVRPLDGGRTSH